LGPTAPPHADAPAITKTSCEPSAFQTSTASSSRNAQRRPSAREVM